MVSTLSEDPGTLQEDIRIKGIFFNDGGTPSDPTDDEWEVRQRLEEDPPASGNFELIDMDVASLGLGYFRPDDGVSPDYPDAFGFSPTVEHDMFTSAVLIEDASGDPRVFAVHAVLPDDGGSPGDFWVVQWYVIDADLGDFISAPIESELWRPAIIESGRIEVDEAHCYHPVLGVSKDGLMTIEYTQSATGAQQEIRRQRFDASYAPLGVTTTLRTGPAAGYGSSEDRWALWGDLQFDPVVGQSICDRLWSTHTLVEEAATSSTDIRDVWLFRQNQSATGFCFQTDMNQSGFTDPIDMMMYTDYYMQGDERADTDFDGYVDATDMANYLDAYDRATSP